MHEVYVQQATPIEVRRRLEYDNHLVRLASNYDFRDKIVPTSAHAALEFAKQEYPNDPRDTVFLAHDANTVVGSLVLTSWQENHLDKRGQAFFPILNTHLRKDRDFRKKLSQFQNPVFDVRGVVISPEYRGKGVGKKLFLTAMETLNPAILGGQTRNPAAVLLRATLPGYRTFFAGKEVTIGRENLDHGSEIARGILISYAFASDIELNNRYFHIDKRPALAANRVDTSTLPEELKGPFFQLNLLQMQIGSSRTVMGHVFSIHESLCRKG